MIKCAVIDDEPLALHQIVTYVEQMPFFELAARCSSAAEAREVLEREPIDVIFIDINMPDLNGMDFVRSLVAPPITVFTTAYSDYAVEAYRVNAADYLLKPFAFDDFRRASLKVKKIYESENKTETAEDRYDNAMYVKADHKAIRLNISDIVYIEGMSEYLKIHLTGSRPIVVLMAMKKMEEKLPSSFMRIHRSYLVNLNRIKEVMKTRVVLEDGTNLPVGDLYKDAFATYVESRYFGK